MVRLRPWPRRAPKPASVSSVVRRLTIPVISSGSVCLALVIALAAPASAPGAPLGELPFQRVAHGTACLAPTGAPGELSRWAEGGAEVLAAEADGLGRPTLVALGELPGCPRAAADASGAAVVAGGAGEAPRGGPGGAGGGRVGG